MWTILAGYLLLPVKTYFHFQGLPIEFDKRTIPILSALIGCVLVAGRRPVFFRKFGITEFLISIILVCPFISSCLNGDALRFGPLQLPGTGPYDGLSAVAAQSIALVPFFLGRQLLSRFEDNVAILRVLAIACLAYSLPMLFEVRMSPQLHYWFYGNYPIGFSNEYRFGGFRPMVFIGNGLLVAFFAMTSTVAATALSRARIRITHFASGNVTTAYLGVILLFGRTVSALLYAFLAVPLVRWASPRFQLFVACVLVSIALIYPMLRLDDMVPTTSLVRAANVVSADRAASLQFQFDQEKMLLDRALRRPWFGWGRYGRNRIYNEDGTDISIIDGYWVDLAGSFGLVDFVAVFGLLAFVVFRASMALKFLTSMEEQICFAALGLLIAINDINLLPNTSLTAWTWLLVGATLGRAEMLRSKVRQRGLAGSSASSTLSIQESFSSPPQIK